ncbi:unnamed protein product [Darwinula stevensoni]|uniref:Achaete scute target 1 n=1 Tax=Darwinula stevensoni TaxID=69355 RepID=A0A7R8X5D7_9CRUS|nr:unnamed protein product [Darwinula stevensoni]CAG0887019.1 unnamed protein product [Darwinula stevensoni]
MLRWLNNDTSRKKEPEVYENVLEGLKRVYKAKILPLEEHYNFHDFHSPRLDDPDFDAKPMILLVGQYSTGKTTFIRYLLERDFPGIRIGPEPTTDGFIAVMVGDQDGTIPGNALVVDPKRQFRPLSKFGNAFLNRFQCSLVESAVLKGISIVDTPGILSGEKQRVDRGYDFAGVLEWFAERVDRIILLFDAHKLDISDELFEAEEQDLFADLQSLPRNSALRKLNDLIKRARLAKVHAYIVSALHDQMPSMFGKEGKKKELVKNLDKVYEKLQLEHQISLGDFPDIEHMREVLGRYDWNKFHSLKIRLIESVDKMLAEEIARLMQMIPTEEAMVNKDHLVRGGAFDGIVDKRSPFGFKRGEGVDAGAGEKEWIVAKDRYKYDAMFDTLNPIDGKITGNAAKQEMVKSKLPNTVLGKIWKLADVDRDGMLDADEFALAMHLINIKLDGHDLPAELPEHLIPPSKAAF